MHKVETSWNGSSVAGARVQLGYMTGKKANFLSWDSPSSPKSDCAAAKSSPRSGGINRKRKQRTWARNSIKMLERWGGIGNKNLVGDCDRELCVLSAIPYRTGPTG